MEHEPDIGGQHLSNIEHGTVDQDALHCLEASIIARHAFEAAVAASVQAIIESNEMEQFSIGQLRMLERAYETNSKWTLAHRVGNEILRRTMGDE